MTEQEQDLGKTTNGQPQEPEPSRDATVIVYGASDDLVEVEGAGLDDEFGCYGTAGGVLTFNDGTKLRIHYGPDGTGCWRIERIATGTAKYSLVVAPDDDEDGEYSDRATLRGDLRSVRFRKAKAPSYAHRAAKAAATQAARASVVLAVDPSRSSTKSVAVAIPPAVVESSEGLREHFAVIDDALDKVICQQRGERRTAAFWHGSEHTESARTTIAVIDAYLDVLEAARTALRAALSPHRTETP